MKTFEGIVLRYVQLTIIVIALYILGWGFTPYKAIFISLGVGSLIGLFNVWSMYRDTKKVGEMAAQQNEGRRPILFGMISRLATGALIAILVIRFPETFDLIGLVLGIMTPYILILFHSLFQIKRF
ncbi:ATP synthase subunit I [Aliibacillus thermotolerans]|uniref:ATP synthase subunit I n=1 Tax=Aliibacillus thermotolerans TaxID=1834418 RepID=A0ABW0U9R7_9BACI|nr:ATP synthase subunit I [Aliibacillus thermotolerans]MDA3129966.1 ATP synthase subunit [Aliibacillus thermotolerans]